MAPTPEEVPDMTAEYVTANKGAALIHVSVAFIVLQAVFLCSFFIARHAKKTLSYIDVWLVPVGFGWNIATAVLAICMVNLAGAGRHVDVVEHEDPSKVLLWLKLDLAVQFTYIYGVTFPKLAVLALYLRIFSIKIYRQIAYFTIAFVILNTIVMTIVGFTICKPFQFNWNKKLIGHCGNIQLYFQLNSLPNLLTDFLILFLPIPTIRRLRAKVAQKIGLTVTFLLGSFGMVTAIIRLYQFSTIDLFGDPTFNCVSTLSWTIIEPGCYLIAAILLSLRPFLGYISQSPAYNYVQTRFSSPTMRQKSSAGGIAPVQDDSKGIELLDEAYIQHEGYTDHCHVFALKPRLIEEV